MRCVVMIGLVVLAGAHAARAQTRVYLSGDLFAEAPKFSRTTVTPDDYGSNDTVPPDSVTAGGGVRIGAFLSPEWSLELGVDLARTISDVRIETVRGFAGLVPVPAPQKFENRTSSRFGATSVLLGYHLPSRGRVHAGFRGGISFMHRVGTFTSATVSTSTSLAPGPFGQLITTMTVTTREYASTGNGIAATLGAEAAIDVSDRLAIVPEVRVHAGGLGAILIRPGVAARWRW